MERLQQPAFPTFGSGFDGMTLRDWFAGMALCGVVARETVGMNNLAERAYALADAMLAAREQREPAPVRDDA